MTDTPTTRTVKIRVQRSDPGAGEDAHWAEYEVPFSPGHSVTSMLVQVNELHDGSLAYRVSCHRGICASCIIKVNGKTQLGCVTEVTGDLELQPAFPTKVIKDLVVEQI